MGCNLGSINISMNEIKFRMYKCKCEHDTIQDLEVQVSIGCDLGSISASVNGM